MEFPTAGTTPAMSELMSEGGAVGPHFVRFECNQTGRPAHAQPRLRNRRQENRRDRAGDLGAAENIQFGDREGIEPGLIIDFLGVQPVLALSALARIAGALARTGRRNSWTRVVKRIAVPPGTKDAIMSVGLMGATGILDVDGLTVELIEVGDAASTQPGRQR